MLQTPIQIQGAFRVSLIILKRHLKELLKTPEDSPFFYQLHGLIKNAFGQAIHLNESLFTLTGHRGTYENNKIKIANIIKDYKVPKPTQSP